MLEHPVNARDQHAFAQLTAPHRRELEVHCYRMPGSLQDALQETLLTGSRPSCDPDGALPHLPART